MVKVLFVCTGNICRSPSAEGVFRAQVEQAGLGSQIEADSAGTGGWHVGEAPDARSQKAAQRRGIDLSGLRGRRVELADFSLFDYILAMDRGHAEALTRMAPSGAEQRIHLFLSFAPTDITRGTLDVPDPYYGGENGFEHVLDLIEAGCRGLLERICAEHALTPRP